MSMTIKVAVLVLAVVAMPFFLEPEEGKALSSETIAKIRNEVLKVHDRMVEAASRFDVEGMFSPILDASNGPIIRDGKLLPNREIAKKATLQAFKGVQKLKYSFDHIFVNVLTPEIALLTGDGQTEMTLSNAREFTTPFALTELFVLRDGEWKVLHAHHSIPNRR